MKTTRRRNELIDMINTRGVVSLKEITEQFDVTKMTIHRDLDFLESRSLIKRIFGGAVSVDTISVTADATPPPPAAGRTTHPVPVDTCLVCRRPVSQHLLYGISLSSGEQYLACCPHCGLSAHQRHKETITSAMTADFISGRPHPAHRSFFLMGSAAAPCCNPSILTFENEEQARNFQQGFGGSIGSLKDAFDFLEGEMIPK
jgi:hypothetical protein